MAKDIVELHEEERPQLSTLMTPGRAAAAKLLHARILLTAEVREGSRCWTDAEIAAALDTSEAPVHRVRQAVVEQGWEAALSRQRPTGRQYRKRDGAQEARLLAFAGSAPPAGRAQGTLPLLADKVVALDVVDTSSAACVRTTLKKTTSNRGNPNNG
jgi:hypothetical protein